MAMVNQYEIYWVNLDPTQGSEIKKTRPAVIVSPNEMNNALKTVIVAPLTSAFHDIPTRVAIIINNKRGYIALDQIRTIDKTRLIGKPIYKLNNTEIALTKNGIYNMLVY